MQPSLALSNLYTHSHACFCRGKKSIHPRIVVAQARLIDCESSSNAGENHWSILGNVINSKKTHTHTFIAPDCQSSASIFDTRVSNFLESQNGITFGRFKFISLLLYAVHDACVWTTFASRLRRRCLCYPFTGRQTYTHHSSVINRCRRCVWGDDGSFSFTKCTFVLYFSGSTQRSPPPPPYAPLRVI